MTHEPRRLGVFGGAFDPPHNGHVALARSALQQLELDQLLVVPTGQAWHKPGVLSSAAHRVAMARLAFQGMERVCVDPRETLRAGPSYTVDTLQELQREHPGAQLFLLLGQDQAQALSGWHRWREVLQFAIICVAKRPVAAAQGREILRQDTVAAGEIPAFRTLDLPPMAVASTEIRALCAGGGSVSSLVPDAVARYISLHHLYLNP